jgi:hypothetical protein
MTYKIVSPRVGTPGDEFVPGEGVNIEALIAGGFVVDTVAKKSAKTTTDEPKD